jgi:hypothetical protein
MPEPIEHYQAYDTGERDVISFGNLMFKAGQLKEAIVSAFDESIGRTIEQKLRLSGIKLPLRMLFPPPSVDRGETWGEEGIDCEILGTANSGWKKGKIRIRVLVEFCAEEDDLADSWHTSPPAQLPMRHPVEDLPTAEFEPVTEDLDPREYASIFNHADFYTSSGNGNGNGNGNGRH